MNRDITVTVSGREGTGKSAVARIIANALINTAATRVTCVDDNGNGGRDTCHITEETANRRIAAISKHHGLRIAVKTVMIRR